MYIRQECLFSFEELIKLQPDTKLELIFEAIDPQITTALAKLPKFSKFGPEPCDRESMLRSLIAKEVEGIKNYKTLIKRINNDPIFRYTCGFSVIGKAPSASTYSRFIGELKDLDLLDSLLEDLVKQAKELGIIDGTHIAIDSSKLESYDAATPKSKIEQDGKQPDWGMKKDTDGNNIRWFGWKVHIATDTKSELPVAVRITPASTSDSAAFMPLIADIDKYYDDIFNTIYYLMDSGYDCQEIYETIHNQYGAQAIIPLNHRGAYDAPQGLDWDCTPVCSMGYKMVYWGHDNGTLKFRCPHAAGKVNCPMGSHWCSSSNYGAVVKKNIEDNPRYFSYPHRGSKKWNKLYNERTCVERTFSRLKEYLGLKHLTLKGIMKTKVHVLLNCISLIAGTLAVNMKSKNAQAA